jgi:hypothetical protein
MRLRTDLVLMAGAVLLLVIGLAMSGQAVFASTYVRDQLSAQRIALPAAEKITDAERNWKPGSACLVEFAGQPVTNGRQAECYANYFIAEHMAASATKAGFAGETYASISTPQAALRAEIAAAKEKKDDATAAAAQKKLDGATALRETFFKGEMLRSALLTVYGFSVLGSVAETAATVSYAGAAFFVLIAALAFLRGRVPAVELQRRAPTGEPTPAR